jgi:hypothetical protein
LVALEAGDRHREDAHHDVIRRVGGRIALTLVLDPDRRLRYARACGRRDASLGFEHGGSTHTKRRKVLPRRREERLALGRIAGDVYRARRGGRTNRRPSDEEAEPYARGEKGLLRCDEYLVRLGDLRLRETQRERRRLTRGDLPLDNPEHLFLERHDLRGETGSLAFDERAVERCMDLAVDVPPNLLDVGVREIGEPVCRLHATSSLA